MKNINIPAMPKKLISYNLEDLRNAFDNVRKFQKENPRSIKTEQYFLYLSARFFHLFELEKDADIPKNDKDLNLAVKYLDIFKDMSEDERNHIILSNDKRPLLEKSAW